MFDSFQACFIYCCVGVNVPVEGSSAAETLLPTCLEISWGCGDKHNPAAEDQRGKSPSKSANTKITFFKPPNQTKTFKPTKHTDPNFFLLLDLYGVTKR